MNSSYKKKLGYGDLEYFDIEAAIEKISPNTYGNLSYTAKLLAENVLRKAQPEHIRTYLEQIIHRRTDIDFPWFPTRVVCHDILGQTALVDLAGLRDAISLNGGDPSKVNPVVPTQLVVDHSLAVEFDGSHKDAFSKNRAIEDKRNDDRFDFIDWSKKAFQNVEVIPSGNGILHQINLEKMSPVIHRVDGVAYPDTLVGTDSHTPHVDALGVLAVGVGGLEAESVMLGRPSWMRMPTIIGVEITGKRAAGITATDIVLQMTQFLRQSKVVSAYLEFYGEGVQQLSLADRATISNMTPEFGATAALFYIDQNTLDYLTITGRTVNQVSLVEHYAKKVGLWADAMQNANYERVLKFDLSQVSRSIAGPSSPHNHIATSALALKGIAKTYQSPIGLMPEGAVIIAAITSCTNTSNPRNIIAAGLLAKKANQLGLVKQPWVKSSFAPGSKVAELYLQEANLLKELEQLGFGIVGFACTTCNGMSGPLMPKIQSEINERDLYTTAVLSGNRNFDGRIHPQAKQAFLASPPLVIAYALAGSIHVDIENAPLGYDKQGNKVFLTDLWPTDADIDAVVAQSVKASQFDTVYIPMFEVDESRSMAVPSLYEWREKSTYIRRPPYWEGTLAKPRRLKNLRPLAILGDNITTDHLSPSNAILPDSAAGEYLLKMGLIEADFNSYATHRGDHLTAQRATFANPKLVNEMVKQAEKLVSGSLARVEPEGKVCRMWEAIETYMERSQPLLIIAGADYGQGSSRDWAAKGVRLAGVEVILAEGFERIHRTNLIGMGVLPLEFLAGENRHTFNLDGTEIYTVKGDISPQSILTVTVQTTSGEETTIQVKNRLDTAEEVSIYEAGGVLQRFADDFLMAESSVL